MRAHPKGTVLCGDPEQHAMLLEFEQVDAFDFGPLQLLREEELKCSVGHVVFYPAHMGCHSEARYDCGNVIALKREANLLADCFNRFIADCNLYAPALGPQVVAEHCRLVMRGVVVHFYMPTAMRGVNDRFYMPTASRYAVQIPSAAPMAANV